MRKINSPAAFTIAELLVVISVISILALWIANIDFKRLSQKQQINIETTKIVNHIEEARNNALIWKWVGVSLSTPESWSTTIENTSSSGSLEISYFSGGLVTYNNWESPFPFSISNLECRRFDNSVDTNSWPFTLIFTWSLGWISGCSDDSYKILNFDYGIWAITQNISINTLSWIIEID